MNWGQCLTAMLKTQMLANWLQPDSHGPCFSISYLISLFGDKLSHQSESKSLQSPQKCGTHKTSKKNTYRAASHRLKISPYAFTRGILLEKCVCMCVCVCMCESVRLCVNVYMVYVNVWMSWTEYELYVVSVYERVVCVCVGVYLHMEMCVHIWKCVLVCVWCMCVYLCECVWCVYMYACICACVCAFTD